MVDKNLLNEYIKYFGDETPFPPEHIMKTLVEMKRDGIYNEKMEEFESFKDEVVGQIEDVSGEKLSLDHPLFDIDFSKIEEDGNISLKTIFWLIYDSVNNLSCQEIVKLCESVGMEQVDFVPVPGDQNLPEFDNGFKFKFKTDRDEVCHLEILERRGEITQCGIQIIMNKFWIFSNLSEHFELLKEYSDSVYGQSQPINIGMTTVLNYGDGKTVCYLSKMELEIKNKKRHILSFRIGNGKFWNEPVTPTNHNQPEEGSKSSSKDGFTIVTKEKDRKTKRLTTFKRRKK